MIVAEEEEEPGCNEVNNCHVNAACTADESSGRYVCVCRSGFNGNGFHCEPSVIGCNVINNCHRDAQCLYDPESIGYRCKCKEVWFLPSFTISHALNEIDRYLLVILRCRVTLVVELPVGHLNRASITRVSAMRTPFALGTLKVTMDAVVAMDSKAMAISVKVRFHRPLISSS